MKLTFLSCVRAFLLITVMSGQPEMGGAQVRLLTHRVPMPDSVFMMQIRSHSTMNAKIPYTPPQSPAILSSQFYVIDTALEVSDQGTMRHLYSFNTAGKKTLDLVEAQRDGQWVNYTRTSYTYDERNSETGWIFEGWSNGQWMNQYRRIIARDAKGRIVSDLYQTWSEAQWANSYRYTYAYDVNGRTLSQMWENWITARWVISWRELYTYDPGGNLLTDTYESWSDGHLADQYRRSFSYDANGRKLVQLTESWTGGQWSNQSRERDTYDGRGRVDTIIYDSWSNDQWMNSTRVAHVYDQFDSLIARVTELWADSTWETYERDSWAYDANRNLLWTLLELWGDNQWVKFWRATQTYNALGNELSAVTEFWRDDRWINNTRRLSEYDEQGNLTSASYDVWENSAWTPGHGMWNLVDSAGNEYRYEPASRIALHYRRLSTTAETNLVQNPGFESGRDHWQFYTNGAGSFSDDAIGAGSPHAGKVVITSPGTNVQLYESGIPLKAHMRYRLSFKAYSSTAHRLSVFLHKHGSPYTSYGLENWSCDLTDQWETFMTEFTSANIADSINDARLRFWFAPYAIAGDQYFIDDVELVETTPHLITNGDFEWGTNSWEFYTDGTGTFDTGAEADASNHAAHVKIQAPGTNVQLYQSGVSLEAGATYRLNFRAYSSSGHVLSVYLHKHGSPYNSYGLDWLTVPLTTSWQTFTKEFTATGFSAQVSDGRLRFWLSPFATTGDEYFFDDITLTRIDGGSGSQLVASANTIEEWIPKEFSLSQNYPNPFNPVTSIKYTIGGTGGSGLGTIKTRLVVYDLLGRAVATLVNERKSSGDYQVTFDGSDLSSGIYICRITAGSYVHSMKMLLVK